MSNPPKVKTAARALAVAAALTCLACSLGPEARLLRQLPQPLPFKPAALETWRLKNGLKVVFMEDREVPLVNATLYIKGGSLWEPQPGLVPAMGRLMRQGGAGSLSADELDLKLESLAAGIDTGFGPEFGSLSFQCLSADLAEVLGLSADILLRPRFEENRLSLWKAQALEQIRRRKDDPESVADIAFQQLLYRDSRYGRILTSADVGRITGRQIAAAHSRFVRPNDGIMAVSGSISRAELEPLLARFFADWQARSDVLPPAPPLGKEPEAGIYFIELPFSQATILMGQLGVPRLTPDYPAIAAFNQIFGAGGFGSRLNARIRTDLGLAYGVFGGISPDLVKGRNSVWLQTKAESSSKALLESMQVLRNMQLKNVPPPELEEKQRAVENSFVFKMDSSAAQVQRRAMLDIWGFPQDFDDTYLDKMRSVTPDDVRKVAETRWDLGKFVIVVVGSDQAYYALREFRPQLDIPAGFSLHKMQFEEKLLLE